MTPNPEPMEATKIALTLSVFPFKIIRMPPVNPESILATLFLFILRAQSRLPNDVLYNMPVVLTAPPVPT
jgi:hypothetical protein